MLNITKNLTQKHISPMRKNGLKMLLDLRADGNYVVVL